MICEYCTKEHAENYGSGRFCDVKCARGFATKVKRKEINKTVSEKLKGKPNLNKGKINLYHHSEETKKRIGKKSKIRMRQKVKNGFKPCINNNGNLTHRKYEKELKPVIEEYFNTKNLIPQKIGCHYFDYVNDKYIIEITLSSHIGINRATNRFKAIPNEKRQKILICPNYLFGELRRNRLIKLNVKHISLTQILPS